MPSSPRLNVLLAASEAAPFAKTGGLADVCGSLPSALSRLDCDARLILPAYRQARRAGLSIRPTEHRFVVPIGEKVVPGRLLESRLPDGDVPVYLIEQDGYFDREGLYAEGGQDYQDNCERFVFFSRAVLEAIRLLDLPVDVLHANDWQTGLVPACLETEYRHTAGYEHVATAMTIHNLAYQGRFWHWDMHLTGLDWKYFNWRQMEFHGDLNLLKTGLVFADAITTVSPTYAREIQTEESGCGLEGVIGERSADVTGILNGIDNGHWDPAADGQLPRNYDVSNWREGKAACKLALQSEMGLPPRGDAPLLGLVGRLAEQKGWDLITDLIERKAADLDAQWVVLGTGEPAYHQRLAELAAAHPEKVAARLEFSDGLAHRIEAGADLFLMPSRYEPCGLNQLFSLRYGSVPLVRATGGLADTVTDATSAALAGGTANGFVFHDYSSGALEAAVLRACDLYRLRPEDWARLVETGMRQDWSWERSAKRYLELYEKLSACRRSTKE